MTITEISHTFTITRERIRQIKDKAIMKIGAQALGIELLFRVREKQGKLAWKKIEE
jgi:hypothetical protein